VNPGPASLDNLGTCWAGMSAALQPRSAGSEPILSQEVRASENLRSPILPGADGSHL
jgi:hypothetical protein